MAARAFAVDKEHLAAIGVFDITPDLLEASGVSGSRLKAYEEAYKAAKQSGRLAPAALILPERLFDEELFLLQKEAEFYTELLD